jgi:hypothetical protein
VGTGFWGIWGREIWGQEHVKKSTFGESKTHTRKNFAIRSCGCGVIYKLAPTAKGQWKYTVLHTFIEIDGGLPEGNLVFDKKGNLYGGTVGGNGVIFELTP